ncbi:hypothetical protein BKA82DRAFT_4067897 [Pisolithus tinctorius]|nr:hypothetical protein BKA82DRAFT_4067897 [Pisolithus tinctorius]
MGIPGDFGATLIGGLVSAMLYGITTLQTYVYYMHYSEDSFTMKFVVAAVWILDTLHTSSVCHILYYYLITNYGNLLSLEHVVWSFPTSFLANLLVIMIVQCFFAHKIYTLCRTRMKWLVVIPILVLVLAHFGFGMEMIVLLFLDASSSSSQNLYYSLSSFVATILPDVLITVSLCILLYEGGSYSVFPRTKRLLNTLIIYAVNRCLLILLVALAESVATIKLQNTWSTALDFTMGKLYSNSLLASLNTRQYLRSQELGTTQSDERVDAVHLTNLQNLSEGVERSNEGEKHIGAHEVMVIDITADSALDT